MTFANNNKKNSPKGRIIKRWIKLINVNSSTGTNQESVIINTGSVRDFSKKEHLELYKKYKEQGHVRYNIKIVGTNPSNLDEIEGKYSLEERDEQIWEKKKNFKVKILGKKITVSWLFEKERVIEEYSTDKKCGVIENTPAGTFVYEFSIDEFYNIEISKFYFTEKTTKKRGRPRKERNITEDLNLEIAKLISKNINKSPRSVKRRKFLYQDWGPDNSWSKRRNIDDNAD